MKIYSVSNLLSPLAKMVDGLFLWMPSPREGEKMMKCLLRFSRRSLNIFLLYFMAIIIFQPGICNAWETPDLSDLMFTSYSSSEEVDAELNSLVSFFVQNICNIKQEIF